MLESRLSNYLRRGWWFGLFVFLFLAFFRPFGLDNLPSGIWSVAGGYGLITFAVIVGLGLLMRLLPESYYREKSWTVGREILWTTIHVALIGMANLLYSHALGFIGLSWRSLLLFEGYTVAIGLFPVTLLVLINEARLNRHYTAGSDRINRDLLRSHAPDGGIVTIPSENRAESLELPADAIRYFSSEGNYVEVWTFGSQPTRHVVRSTLKAIEAALTPHEQFLRCHKGYIVNLHHVESVSGNAQGFKLHLRDIDSPVPVSRQQHTTLRQRLAVHP